MTWKPKVSPAIFIAVILCFCMQFVTVSCGGQRVAGFSGVQLAAGTTIEQPQMFGPPQKQKVGPDPAAAFAALCAILGLGLSFLGSGLVLGPAISGGVGALSLVILKSRIDDQIAKQGGGMFQVNYEAGFIMALLLFLGATAWNAYMFWDKRRTMAIESSVAPLKIISLMLLGVSLSAPTFAQTNASATVVTRFIQALQGRNYKTVIDLSYQYQSEISAMKAQNPQALWPKLIKEYYDSRLGSLDRKTASGQNLGEALRGMIGDPGHDIRSMEGLLPPGCKSKVTETRADHVKDSIQFGGYDRTIVYVMVTYPTIEDAPFVDEKFLKEAILEFDLNSKSQLIMKMGRLPQGDTPWDAPLMIMNTSWQLQQVPFSGQLDGHLRAEAIGGKSPYIWRPVCGSNDLSKNLTKRDGLGQPIDQRNVPYLMVDLDRFSNNMFPLRCTVTVTDETGKSDTVAMTVPRMLTGFNAYCYVRAPWFSRGQGRPGQPTTCIEPVLAAEAASASVVPLEPTTPVTAGGGTPSLPVNPSNPPSACGDYNGCMRAAMTAYHAKDWSTANAAFESAAMQRPTSGEPWVWIGRILLRDGQAHRIQDLSRVWDKSLSLGATILIGACHERTLQPCERGDLALSVKSISFLASGTRMVFSAPPSAIDPGRLFNNSAAAHITYTLKADGKNYTFDFFPLDVVCTVNLLVQCPRLGIEEQLMLSQYVAQTIPQLVRGTLSTATNSPDTEPTGVLHPSNPQRR